MSENKITLVKVLVYSLTIFVALICILSLLSHLQYQSEVSSQVETEFEKYRKQLYRQLLREGAKVLDVPFVKQKPWYCSEASASMVLRYYGYNVSQDDVHNAGYESFEVMLPFLRKYINCKYAKLTLDDLRREIDKGRPVIIRIVVGNYLHSVVVVGYKDDYFYIHDPARGPYVKVSSKDLWAVWSANQCKAIVILEEPPKTSH